MSDGDFLPAKVKATHNSLCLYGRGGGLWGGLGPGTSPQHCSFSYECATSWVCVLSVPMDECFQSMGLSPFGLWCEAVIFHLTKRMARVCASRISCAESCFAISHCGKGDAPRGVSPACAVRCLLLLPVGFWGFQFLLAGCNTQQTHRCMGPLCCDSSRGNHVFRISKRRAREATAMTRPEPGRGRDEQTKSGRTQRGIPGVSPAPSFLSSHSVTVWGRAHMGVFPSPHMLV